MLEGFADLLIVEIAYPAVTSYAPTIKTGNEMPIGGMSALDTTDLQELTKW